ncbi:MAG TPA: SRPBCC domain-containing protein [Bacteroidales bacterium]|nr:SRPBCC domain-containing protein [Bacteroidales bacterium]
MKSESKTKISRDLINNRLKITREFEAPIKEVWNAWTDSKLLDLWWAPKPWKSKTKSMDFREGGFWLYAMIGLDGTQSWSRADYKAIVPDKMFIGIDNFCDEEGTIDSNFPGMHWKCEFRESPRGTIVQVEITFSDKADLEKIIEMGFEAGFTSAHENLDELLRK